ASFWLPAISARDQEAIAFRRFDTLAASLKRFPVTKLGFSTTVSNGWPESASQLYSFLRNPYSAGSWTELSSATSAGRRMLRALSSVAAVERPRVQLPA